MIVSVIAMAFRISDVPSCHGTSSMIVSMIAMACLRVSCMIVSVIAMALRVSDVASCHGTSSAPMTLIMMWIATRMKV